MPYIAFDRLTSIGLAGLERSGDGQKMEANNYVITSKCFKVSVSSWGLFSHLSYASGLFKHRISAVQPFA